MRIFQSGLLIIAFIVLPVSLYRFGEGFHNWHRARRIKQHYLAELVRLRRERDELKGQVEKLKHNELAKERLARRLGYVKPGEVMYKIVQAPGSNHTNSP